MRRGLFRAAAALALCWVLAVPARAEAAWPEKEHQPVDYGQMEKDGYDAAQLEAALARLEELAASPAAGREDPALREELKGLYETVLRETDLLATRAALADIRYDGSGLDQEAADASAALSLLSTDLFDRCYQTLALLADTPYRDLLEADAGAEGLEELRGYQALTEEESALLEEEQRLVQDYDRCMAQPAEVTAEGRTWTAEDLEADETLDDETWWQIYTLLQKERNRAAGEIFLRLVRVRTELARGRGCDSYAEYAYEAAYGRDYDLEDMASVRRMVKETWVPLEARLTEAVSERDLRALEVRTRQVSGETILDALEPYMDRLDPELGATFAFMRQYHLCDIEQSGTKLPVGYTVSLPAYGTAFLFNAPYGDYQDYSTLIHEFGHFNESFHSPAHALWDPFHIDVGEIHSQGLEVLFTAWSRELFGPEGGRAFRLSTISNMVTSVLDGCMYDEFQEEVYANPERSLEEVNRLFKDISEEYGYFYEEGEEESWFWVEIPHTFQSPMYYISYATSALSALDLWLRSLEDWDGAVETYLELSAMGMSRPYRETVEAVGLRDIFRGRTVEELAEGVEAELLGGGGPSLAAAAVPAAACGAVVVIAAAVLVHRGRRRALARARAEEMPWEIP